MSIELYKRTRNICPLYSQDHIKKLITVALSRDAQNYTLSVKTFFHKVCLPHSTLYSLVLVSDSKVMIVSDSSCRRQLSVVVVKFILCIICSTRRDDQSCAKLSPKKQVLM